MALTNYKLGTLIELLNDRNTDLQYGVDDVRGVNNLKKLMPTKADLNGRNLSKFQIVRPENFVFNHRTSRNGSKFSIAFNDTDLTVICTEDYVVFRIKEECKKVLNPLFLYMYFNRDEFDRYVITNSWGSSTEFYNWEDLCDIDIALPSLSVQQKYVNVYQSMLANQKSYEQGLEDLKLSIDALLDKFKKSSSKCNVGEILEEIDNRNIDDEFTEVSGVNITKQFMPSVASSDNLRNYKVVKKGQFVFSGMQTGRDKCIRIALLDKEKSVIVSPAYSVLQVKKQDILPEFIQMWFSRSEMDRLGWFMSDSSVRSNLDLPRFYEIKIPIPTIQEQTALINIYSAYTTRRNINEQLKAQIKNLCPILIKGSLEEGENGEIKEF